ncbi:hypothetical protein [Sandaracinus amylolyticus]|uniref:hypothetical protein n=1 Tax=Sandaracinus amylolyticus TaxID=927083 RepID=UPI001F1A91B7|nr:hypothetical protein [Sandaracinus amylolyticus]
MRDIEGHVIEACVALGATADGRIEKLILRVGELGWRDCYLSVFIAFWHALDDDGLSFVREICRGLPERDLGHELGLTGSQLVHVRCGRESGRVVLEIATTRAVLRLIDVDARDPHADTRVEWGPPRNT